MLLTRLMNAPQPLQQGIAMALVIVVLLAPLTLAVDALLALQDQSAQIAELRERAGKLAALAAMKDEAVKLAAVSASGEGGGLLTEAENLPIAKANLQSRIGAMAQAHGASVSSSGAVPDVEEGGLLLIGLRADLSGTNEAIAGFLADVETSKPPLLVREFSMRSEGVALADRPPALSASIRLYAAVSRPAETGPSAAGAAEAVQ